MQFCRASSTGRVWHEGPERTTAEGESRDNARLALNAIDAAMVEVRFFGHRLRCAITSAHVIPIANACTHEHAPSGGQASRISASVPDRHGVWQQRKHVSNVAQPSTRQSQHGAARIMPTHVLGQVGTSLRRGLRVSCKCA